MIWMHPGVNSDFCTEIWQALRWLEREANRVKQDIYITSGRDGQHQAGSFHPSGRAVDIRAIPYLDVQAIRSLIGSDYDVVDGYADGHIHIEYDPK